MQRWQSVKDYEESELRVLKQFSLVLHLCGLVSLRWSSDCNFDLIFLSVSQITGNLCVLK